MRDLKYWEDLYNSDAWIGYWRQGNLIVRGDDTFPDDIVLACANTKFKKDETWTSASVWTPATALSRRCKADTMRATQWFLVYRHSLAIPPLDPAMYGEECL